MSNQTSDRLKTEPRSLWAMPALWTIVLALALALAASGGGEGGGGGNGDGAGDDGGVTVGQPSTAVNTIVLEPGDEDCPFGGIRVESGIDENGNGVLDPEEVDTTEKVCNGAPGAGQNSLVTTTDLAADDSDCPEGGVRIDVGVDDNGDGVLDPEGVDSPPVRFNGRGGGATGYMAEGSLTTRAISQPGSPP